MSIDKRTHMDYFKTLLEKYSKTTGLYMVGDWTNLRSWKKYSSTEVLTILQVRQGTYDNKIQTLELKYRPAFKPGIGMQNRFVDQVGDDIDSRMFNTTDIKIVFLLWWEYTLKNIKTPFPIEWMEELTVFQLDVMKTIKYFDKYSDEDKVKIYTYLQDDNILPKTVQDIFLF